MQLTSYDQDLLRQLIAHNFDLGQVAFNRYIRRDQLEWWSRQPHIAQALITAKHAATQPTHQPSPTCLPSGTPSLRYSGTSQWQVAQRQ